MRTAIILSFCFLFIHPVFSQSPFFRQLSINRENTNLNCNTIYTDHDGLIWAGTSEGLYQYDGNGFILYTIDRKDFENDVTAISQDSNNTFWVGYKSGKIALLKNDVLKIFEPEEGLPKKAVTSILKSKRGIMWITTAGEGVYFYLNNRLYNINQDDGLNDNYTYTSVEDNAGNIWIGTDQGIAVCKSDVKNKIIKKISYKNNLPDEIIRCMKNDMQGNIWIGMQDKGICKYVFAENKIEIPSAFTSWQYGQINNFNISDNEFWIATEENGLVNYNSLLYRSFKNYKAGADFSFSKTDDVIKDAEGNIWAASHAGLIKSSGNCLTFLNEVNGKKINFIHTLLCDKMGNLLFTPDQQLTKISFNENIVAESNYIITVPEKLIDITSLYEDKWGYIWIGTMGDGLFRLNPRTGNKIKLNGLGLPGNESILSIGGEGNEVWLATLGGVIKCVLTADGNTDLIHPAFYGLETQKEIGNYFIYNVFIDSKKRVWFATDGKGLTCYDQNKYTNYSIKDGLKSDVVYSITEDGGGNIWFSVSEAGIYKFDGKKFYNYNQSNGLRELTATGIVYDGNGNIVIVHHKGFDVLNIKTGVVTYFGAENNLEEINPDLNSITIDQKGNVWIGTEKGIVVFNSHFKPATAKPRSLIKKVTLISDNSLLTDKQQLKYNQNNISFDFTSVWYSDPERVRYKYLLEGYNKEWVITKDKEIIFPELPPGPYTFRLQSALNDNFTQPSEASFSFYISKPLWSRLWFRLCAILFLTAIAFYYVRWRERELRKLEILEKEKIKFQLDTLMSQVNPHFLFNSFNTLISIIENDKHLAVEYVENLSEFFRNLITYRNKDLITLKEEMKLSSAYYFMQQKRFGKNLEMKIDIKEEEKELLLPPLVVQLLIENAIKHNAVSKETPLTITINTDSDKLIIKNNINPKQSAEPSTKTGLQNIIDRYKLLTKREIQIVKTEKEFTVSIPLINSIKT
ncbi:MAG: two-component regulator propeller domain-containing protein [Bacteroidia bacterium]